MVDAFPHPLAVLPPAPLIARESVPEIKMRSVLSAWHDNRPKAEWRDQHRMLVARGELVDLNQADMTFTFEWVDGTQVHQHEQGNLLERRHGPAGRVVADALCPRCARPAPALYFFEHAWRCATCHDLTALKNVLTAEQALNLRYWEAHALVPRGPPPARGIKTYDRRRLKLARIADQLEKLGGSPSLRTLPTKLHLEWIDHRQAREAAEYGETLQPLPISERAQKPPLVLPYAGERRNV